MSIRAVVTDIEGTTTSISFVFDVLFPYAREHIAAFVRSHEDAPAVASELKDVAREVGHDLTRDEAIGQLIEWIDQDRKVTPLKTLQGMVWKQGFKNADFTGHVYADAVDGLRRWHARGLALYVYSSGSVAAQKLLFAHSDFGDLTPLFSGYFDTHVGAKREADSYRRIATAIGLEGGEILFLSDIAEELDAAAEARWHTAWLVRDPSTCVEGASHPICRDFTEVALER